MAKSSGPKIFASNRKAFADFDVVEKFEAGIKLLGPEVKSVRHGSVNLTGGAIDVKNAEVWLKGVHIGPYKYAADQKINPLRNRKLLLHEKEIVRLATELESGKVTAIPLELYAKNRLIKLLIGLCRRKKKWDRRQELKKKGQMREIERALKRQR